MRGRAAIPETTIMSERGNLLPLRGIKVVEFEGIGPGPLCGALLAGLAPRSRW